LTDLPVGCVAEGRKRVAGAQRVCILEYLIEVQVQPHVFVAEPAVDREHGRPVPGDLQPGPLRTLPPTSVVCPTSSNTRPMSRKGTAMWAARGAGVVTYEPARSVAPIDAEGRVGGDLALARGISRAPGDRSIDSLPANAAALVALLQAGKHRRELDAHWNAAIEPAGDVAAGTREVGVPLRQSSSTERFDIVASKPVTGVRVGRSLAALRDEGVIFMASGGMTHNLAAMDPGAEAPSWAREFDAWAAERITALDVDALLDWRARAPAVASRTRTTVDTTA